jgi:hypothetical protein
MQDFWFRHADNDTYMVQVYQGNDPEVTVPASWYGCDVTVLMDDIFKGHTEITKVNLPDTITDIGGFVFDGCTSLKSIVLPEKLHTLWQYAFVRSSFEELAIPPGVTDIVPFCFQDCTSLRRIVLSADHVRLMGWSFLRCTSLREVVLPQSAAIHENAFAGCEGVNLMYKTGSQND